MLFNTPVFLFVFLPAVFFIHAALAGFRFFRSANLVLTAASLFFYAWGNPAHLWLLVFCGIFNFVIGLFVCRPAPCKRLLIVGLVVNIGLLAVFKYAGMLLDPLVFIGGEINPDWNFIQNIALPLGISFYTFQGMSYIIDCWRGDCRPQDNLVDFLAYLCMFPQLVAGPIVRYGEIAPNLRARELQIPALAAGIRRFIYGLAKKCLLADTFAQIADACFAEPAGMLSGGAAWLGAASYTLQIFFDFSAYSDMAIGLGCMLGFRFPENFNHPYLAVSIGDFWRRWHMTLSHWLRDYIYIPLGGSRISLKRTCLNITIVFALCGLWHGASYNFLLWGLYYSVFLVLERVLGKKFAAIPVFLRRIYALTVIVFGWVLFRAPDLTSALTYYKAMFFCNDASLIENYRMLLALHGYYPKIAFLAAAILIVWPFLAKNRISYFWLRYRSFLPNVGALVLFGISCMMVFGASHRYFIYFRF